MEGSLDGVENGQVVTVGTRKPEQFYFGFHAAFRCSH